MAGIGDEWGTEDELLHPRGPDGRWIRSGGVAKNIIGRVLQALAEFSSRHRSFQSRGQATQFLQNVASRQGARRMGRQDHVRLARDLGPANADLRDGVIDEPSTKKFVDMMDRSATELPDPVIITRTVGVDAFGFTPETANGTSSDSDPGIRGMAGKLVADRGYGLGAIDGPHGSPPGTVRMVIAAPKGTKVIIPAAGANDPTILTDRGQPLRVTKVKPDGNGGWTMMLLAEPHDGKDVPEPIGGPLGPGREKSATREARIRETQQSLARLEKVPDEQKEQETEAAKAAERAKMGEPVPSPQQEAERRRVEQQQPPRQPAPGEPPLRTEPAVGRVGEAPTVPQPAPGANVPEAPAAPRRAVDLRLAVRDAKVPSPSAGPRRRAWNEAYLGVTGGKKDPIDAVRELDADIATLRRGGEIGRGAERGGDSDATRESDTDALQQLRDVIAREYGLEPSAPAEKVTPAKAVPRTGEAGLPKQEGITPVKRAPSKRAVKAVPAPGEGPMRVGEARRRTAVDAVQANPITGEGDTPYKRILKGLEEGRVTVPAARQDALKSAKFWHQRALESRDLGRATPEERRRIHDKNTKIATQYEELAQALTDSQSAEKTDKYTKGVKKAAPAKKAAPVKKAAPEAPGDDLDKMTKAELLAEAEKRDVKVTKSWTKDKIKAALKGEAPEPRKRAPVKKAAKKVAPKRETKAQQRERVREFARQALEDGASVPGFDKDPVEGFKSVRQVLEGQVEDPSDVEGFRGTLDLLSVRNDRGPLGDFVSKVARQFRQDSGIAEAPPVDRPVPPRAAVPSAPEAPSAPATPIPESSAGTAAGKVTIGRLVPGTRILVRKNSDGSYSPTTRKTGATVLNVEGVDAITGGPGRSRSRRVPFGRDDEGNEIRVEGPAESDGRPLTRGFPSHQTFWLAPQPGQKRTPAAKKAVKAAKAAPAPLDAEEGARVRQEEIFNAKRYADTAAELDQLIHDDANDKAILTRFNNTVRREGVEGSAIDSIRFHLEAGRRDEARVEMRRLLAANGVTPSENAGDTVKYNPRVHQTMGGANLNEGDTVQVVTPGHRATIRGEEIQLRRPVVERADPAREKGPDLVPEGSVAGPRTETPVDNAPRKRELRAAWIAADIQAPPGPGRKSQEEIKGDLLAGRITPEEAIRRFESEIAFTNDDLTEVKAHLREGDLSPAERAKVERHRANLLATIDAHEKQSTFLRDYFKEEAPVVSLEEAKVQDPVAFEFLKDTTPDDLREAAKEAGLDPPEGDTPDEMFKSLLKQIARKELDRRAAKKAAKKAPAKAAKKAAPAVPAEKERIDARLLAEGIDGLDDDVIADLQKYFDGEAVPGSGKNPTPAKIADWLNFRARGSRDSTAIIHGSWTESLNPDSPRFDPEYAEKQRLEFERGMARAAALEELAGRVRGVRRRSVKKAAPAKAAAPEVEKLQAKVDDLEKRRIDDALGELQGTKSRDKGDAALEGLTLPELRRLAEQSGVPTARTKRGLRDNILDRFIGTEEKPTVDSILDRLEGVDWENPPSRDEMDAMLAPFSKKELMVGARRLSIPGPTSKTADELRREIREATVGRRLDSIATRGFTGERPGIGDVAGRPDAPEPPTAPAPSTRSLSARARDAGIDAPGRTFSGVDSAVSTADSRLKAGVSPTVVARDLRERASQVAKADLNEEGRRFTTLQDKDTLRAIRKQSAEYLRRVATHVQQEGRGRTPAKKTAPSTPGAPSPSRTGTSPAAPPRPTGLSPHPNGPVSGERSTSPETPNNWGALGTGGDVEFHADGVVGTGLGRMGDDRLMDVDGEPLSNVVGKLATRAIRGQISQEQLLDELRRLEQRLPEGSRARRGVASMIEGIDAPERAMPDLPQGVLPPFRTAMQGLLRIPLTRGKVDRPGFHRDSDDSEVDKLLRMIQDFQEGRTGGLRMINDIQEMRHNLPHESQEGRFEADRVLRQLHDELEKLYKDKDTRGQLMPKRN